MVVGDKLLLIKPNNLSINLANATKAITLAAIIKIKRPAPKIESPKKEKNGSRAGLASLTCSLANSSEPLVSVVAVVSSTAALPEIFAMVS
ncbi:hypothetical protein WP50_28870 [Lactiplantibacillus plantarum]|nr:hypothetical protein WP50_28870 [Lactiplantibacillus plantarum]